MLALSVSFLFLSYVLTWWAGAVGFILANCLNMGLRILHSLLYIHGYFQASPWKPLRGLRPSPLLMLALGTSAAVTALSEVRRLLAVFSFLKSPEIFLSSLACFPSQGVFCCDRGWTMRLVHVGVGAACLLGVFVAVLLTETRLVQFVRTQLLPQYSKKHTWFILQISA